jgi:hypothetical protein
MGCFLLKIAIALKELSRKCYQYLTFPIAGERTTAMHNKFVVDQGNVTILPIQVVGVVFGQLNE